MRIKKIITIILIFLWCIVIFNASNKNSLESNNTSKEVITTSLKGLITVTNSLNITSINLNSNWLTIAVNKLNYPVRKCAHATIYFILGVLIFAFLHTFGLKDYQVFFITVLLCFSYSLTDEYHQTFVTNRTGKFSDCLIDTTGALFSSGILYLAIKNKQNKAAT